MNRTDNIRVQIVQPLIPAYRSALFVQLVTQSAFKIRVCASKTVPGIPNLVSVDNNEKHIDLTHSCKGFLGNKFLWQKNLQLDPKMKQGDVLIVSGNLRFLSNLPLIFQAKRKKIGLIWWGHGLPKQSCKIKNILNRIVMHFIDVRLLYTDKEIKDYIHQGFPPKKLFATNNAIDLEPIKKATLAWSPNKLNEFQVCNNLHGKKILLFCGRRTNSIALELVYEALAQLQNNNEKYIFVIIGSKKSSSFLKTKAKELEVEDYVRWLGPMFKQQDLAPWFLSAHCFVYPGPIGLSLLHAFSFGLPVIVPDCTHCPEIVALNDGENGLFYKDGNIDDLKKKITTITEDPIYNKKMSAKALQIVQEKYNMGNMVSRYMAAIQAASQRACDR